MENLKGKSFNDSDLNGKTKEYPLTLEGLLQYAFQEEPMVGDNRIRCEKCGDVRRDGTKKMEIEEPPDHLIINLARFQYNYRANLHTKIFKNIHYPQQITLPLTSKNGAPLLREQKYWLYSVVIHSGLSAHSGHYYAYARPSHVAATFHDAPWSKLNDSSVGNSSYYSFSRITESLSRDVPYLLFYVKEDLKVSLPEKILPELLHLTNADNDKYSQELKQKKNQAKTTTGVLQSL